MDGVDGQSWVKALLSPVQKWTSILNHVLKLTKKNSKRFIFKGPIIKKLQLRALYEKFLKCQSQLKE